MHSSKERAEDCTRCLEKGTLKKLLSNTFFKKSNIKFQKKVGDITEEFIDSAREELQRDKEEAIIKTK